MFISSTPIFSGLQSSPTVDSQSLNILMSLSVLHFVLTVISAVSVCCMLPRLSCLLTRHNDVIDACLPRALIWIGHFVYYTFKKVRFYSYKYVINIYYIYIQEHTKLKQDIGAVVIVWQLDLHLAMQSVLITTKVVSLNPVHDGVYSIQHCVIKFVSDLRQIGGFLRVLRFPPPIKLTSSRYN